MSIGCNVFGMVSFSVFWLALGYYWLCVLGKVSLSVLWRVLDVCIFGKTSLSV